VNLTHLALAFTFAALSAAMFARAGRATDGKVERNSRFAGTLMAVGAVALLVAFSLSFLTGAAQ
jgi:hypothetical protein